MWFKRITRRGNSYGIPFPKQLAELAGFQPGDVVALLHTREGFITIRKVGPSELLPPGWDKVRKLPIIRG